MATGNVSNNPTIDQIIQSTQSKKETRKTGGELGKDDFLNLLVTQLRYQDPLEPTNDKEFIAQMAQFSSLEQMQNMNGVLTKSQAFNMIGKDVTANITDPKTFEVKTVTGNVTTVKMRDGKAFLLVNNQEVEADKVVEVNDSIYNTYSNLSEYTNLIGFRVKGAVYDSSNGNLINLSGDVKEIQKGVNEDYAVMDDVDVEIAEVTGAKSTTPAYTKDYLEQNLGKEVKVTIKDSETGSKVPVTATLKSYDIDEKTGKITAVLDNLYVSVYSVSNIRKQEAGTGEQETPAEDGTTGN